MLIQGCVKRSNEEGNVKGIANVSVIISKTITDPQIYRVNTDNDGNFKIVCPSSFFIEAESKEKSTYMIISHPDYYPIETYISTPDAQKMEIDVKDIFLKEYKVLGLSRRWIANFNIFFVLLIAIGFISIYLFAPVKSIQGNEKFIETYLISLDKIKASLDRISKNISSEREEFKNIKTIDSIITQLQTTSNSLKNDFNNKFINFRNTVQDQYYMEIKNRLDEVKSLKNFETVEIKGEINSIEDDTENLLKTLDQFLLELSASTVGFVKIIKKYFLGFYLTSPYWWNVVFWAIFGALAGILWILVQTIILGNYASNHFFSLFYRIIFAPFYAVVFIFLIRIFGIAAEGLSGSQVAIAPTQAKTQVELVITFSFLIGLYVERLHERFRSLADLIFKSKFLGGKVEAKEKKKK